MPSMATADAQAERSGVSFRVFNAMLYQDMPTIGERLTVVYESSFYPKTASAQALPTDQGIANAVRDAYAQSGRPWFASADLVAVDVERWQVWPFVKGDAHRQAVARYGDLARRFREQVKRPICLYGIAPEAGINQAVQAAQDPALRAQWHAASDITKRLVVPHVDALCPSLYSYYDSPDPAARTKLLQDWQVYARATIAEARRIAPGKPVYPFLWPQFHQGGSVSGNRFVPTTTWREQLQTVRDSADGLILWGGWDLATNKQMPWEPDAQWWQTFQEVFAKR